MKTIEDYMRVAFDLGKIAGAAETIEDEYTRDSIYGSACELLDEVIREASKIETECQHAKGIVQSTPDCRTADEIDEILRSAPPDPFDMVETGEMVETPAQKPTNFSALTKSPETLAVFLAQNAEACVRGECTRPEDPTLNECVQCMIDWLKEERTDD